MAPTSFRWWIIGWFLLLALLMPSGPVLAETRLGLVVGNQNYIQSGAGLNAHLERIKRSGITTLATASGRPGKSRATMRSVQHRCPVSCCA